MITRLRNNRKSRELQKRIEARIQYNSGIRRMEAGERSMKKLAENHKQQAIAAETKGDHAAAIRLADGYQKMEKQSRATSDMKNTIMTAHAIAESTKALSDLMSSTSGLAGAAALVDPAEMYKAQIEMEIVRDGISMAIEQTAEAFDEITGNPEMPCFEAGEEALKTIMRTAHREKNNHVLKETGKKLDALQRSRTLE